MQLRAVEHVKAAVQLEDAHVGKVPALGVLDQLLLPGLAAADFRFRDSPRQHIQLVQAQADGSLKVGGDLLAETGHVHSAHRADGAGALPGQKRGQQRENRHAQSQHQAQTALEKARDLIRYRCFLPHASSPLTAPRFP